MCKSPEVSRSGYYKWLKHEKTDEEKENEQIAQLVGEYDERFNHTLGYRRLTGYMNRLNQKQYGEKRIYRIMTMMGIRSVIRKKAKKYQHCEYEMVAENILKRDFYAGRPNENGQQMSRSSNGTREERSASCISVPFWICTTGRS